MTETKMILTNNSNTITKLYAKAPQNKNNSKKWFYLVVILFLALIGFQQKEIYDLQISSSNQQQDITQIKKVYVYNLEDTLRGVNLEKLNQEFEEKLNILNEEVSIAQEKISSLKETKEKDNFSEIYLKSLKLKRDTMVQEYHHTLENLTEQINQAVTEIAKEKKALVILDLRAVASLTDNVEDVTDEVIKRVKITRPQAMNE